MTARNERLHLLNLPWCIYMLGHSDSMWVHTDWNLNNLNHPYCVLTNIYIVDWIYWAYTDTYIFMSIWMSSSVYGTFIYHSYDTMASITLRMYLLNLWRCINISYQTDSVSLHNGRHLHIINHSYCGMTSTYMRDCIYWAYYDAYIC